MNADENESKSSMSKQASGTLKEKGKEVVAEVEPTKEVTTAQPVEARDKAKDAPNTGPELFPETVPPCVAKLTAPPVGARDKVKDAPTTGPELFPETVPPCVAELGNDASSYKATGAFSPEIVPMTIVASATKDEGKQCADHVAKIKESRKGGGLKMAPPDEDGPECLPETVKSPASIGKLGSEKSSGNNEDMVNVKAGSAGTKMKFDMGKSKPNKSIDVTKRATITHATASKAKHGMDDTQGMTLRIREDDGSAPLTLTTSVANLSSNQTGNHQSAGATVSTCNDMYEKRQAMAENNRRLRERRKMRRQEATSNNEDLDDEGLSSSFPPRVGDNEGTNIAPPTLFSDQYDEMKLEEEEILNQLDKDENQQPGAFAVAGIGAGDPSYAWQSTLEMPESQDSTENKHNANNNQAHLSNEDMISMPDQKVSDGSENLISAIVVDDDAIPQAEAVSEEVLQRNKRKRTLCCLVGLALLMVTIVFVVVLSRDRTTVSPAPSQSLVPSTSPSELPSQNPTSIPSTSPSMSPTSSVQLFLEGVSPLSTAKAFEDETSPQFKALTWLEHNHPSWDVDYSTNRIIQRFVLATLYYSTKGDQWIQWNGGLNHTQHECKWFSAHPSISQICPGSTFMDCNEAGNECSLFGNEYHEIKLPSNRLQGTLPREIYLLSNLRMLDLSDNVLRESLPSEVGLLRNIKTINLKGNSFDGSLPIELGDLKTSLTQLDLSSNNIDGKIPSAVGLLTGLESLKLDDNILSGTVISEIGTLSDLKTLSLTGNILDGTVPTQMASLQNLEVLDFTDNLLSGSLPLAMNQTSTQSLVPSLLKLKELRAQSNFITGTLPSILGLMSKLELLNMNSNRLEGSVPSEMGLISSLNLLNLNSNSLEGFIPSELGLISNLAFLNMNSNRLYGSIPAEIGHLVQLETLDLSGNTKITGILPTELGLLVRLESMLISQTRISGFIGTEIVGMEKLKFLDLSRNHLNRLIPETMGSLVNLESLDLSSNDFRGLIPETLGSLVNLEYLHLGYNGLSGWIPETLGSLVNLEYLHLGSNRLGGMIPETLWSLVNLEYLHLGKNGLSGPIPETLGSLVNLEYLHLGKNGLSGPILETLWSLVNLESLDLSFIGLSGTIPETLGSLVNLEYLSLSYNGLSGRMPETLGSLVNLGYFVISSNDLTGEVPKELCEVRRTNNIGDFWIDCEEISCDCCFDSCPNPPRILNSTSSTANCSDGTTLLQVATGTDRDPEGVEWDIVNKSTNETLIQGGPLTQDDVFNTILQETCVSNDACLVFTIRGSNGDGYYRWYGNNYGKKGDRFMVHLNGSEVSNGRLEDFQEEGGFFVGETSSCVATDRQKACSVTHPTCDSPGIECNLDNDGGLSGFCVPNEPSMSPSISPAPSLSPSSSPAPSLSPAPSSSPSQLPTASPSTSPAPSLSPSSSPTTSPSASLAPSLSPSSNPTYTPCDDGFSNIVIELTTDEYAEETWWELVNDATGDVILKDGNYDYADEFKTFVSQTCTSSNACLRFTIYDSFVDFFYEGGGYVIYVNNEQVASGGGYFGLSETKVIGSCSESAFPNASPSTSSSMPTASPTTPIELLSIHPTAIVGDDDESLSPPCQDGMVNFTVEIMIENDPERVAWTVVHTNSGSTPSGDGSSNDAIILLEGGPYSLENDTMNGNGEGSTVVKSTCVVSDACLVFEIHDSEGAAVANNDNNVLSVFLATVNLFSNDIRIAIAYFWGPTVTTEVGACSPIQ